VRHELFLLLQQVFRLLVVNVREQLARLGLSQPFGFIERLEGQEEKDGGVKESNEEKKWKSKRHEDP